MMTVKNTTFRVKDYLSYLDVILSDNTVCTEIVSAKSGHMKYRINGKQSTRAEIEDAFGFDFDDYDHLYSSPDWQCALWVYQR